MCAVCEECAKKIGEYIEGLRADMRGEEYASKGIVRNVRNGRGGEK